MKRNCGILLHPTSLPSAYGIGDLGREAYRFIDFLRTCEQRFWQILPLNPVGYGNSPYQSFSAFAGNPMLLSIDSFLQEGFLRREELDNQPVFNKSKVDFAKVVPFKEKVFRKVYSVFNKQNKSSNYESFIEENKYWLNDYGLFMALKNHYGGKPWYQWPQAIAFRKDKELTEYKRGLSEEIAYQKFLQFMFFSQWKKLKEYANKNGIQIIGDLPIFIAHDSSDLWSNPHLFKINKQGQLLKSAGVPPDYFSSSGQLWGNPHYRWDKMEKDDYLWWRKRFEFILKNVDLVRLDHFRGFESCWAVGPQEKTAIKGKWIKGPGEKFFSTLENHLGKLAIIAEDLGVITPEVTKIKDKFNFPGMKILQFIMESDEDETFQELFKAANFFVYTGTHDNDTTLGWYKKQLSINPEIEYKIRERLKLDKALSPHEISWQMIKLAYQSNAKGIIVPLQDILGLDTGARMNIPGTTENNWSWRFMQDDLNQGVKNKLLELTLKYRNGSSYEE